MKKGFVQLWQWAKAHPVKAGFFACLFIVIGVCAGAMSDYWVVRIGLPVFALGLGLFIWTLRVDMKKLIGLGLAFALCGLARANPEPAEPELQPAAYVAAGVVVVTVGTVAVFMIYRFCQRHFEPPPPPPPEPEAEAEAEPEPEAEGAAAAATFQNMGSCLELVPASISITPEPTVLELTGQIVGDDFRLTSLRKVESAGSVDFDELNTALSRHGIQLDDHYTGLPHYGRNGEPARPEDVPVRVDMAKRAIVLRGGGSTMYVERSIDLETWEPVLSAQVPDGQRIRLLDTITSDRMFYRIRTSH